MTARPPVRTEESAGTRLAFIDNIRWTMILLVLTMHACDTYSPFGNWYFTDRRPLDRATAIGFGLYQSFLQAFFMALLFFIAGYFAASSLARKHFRRFAIDRFLRLGLPTLLYMFVVGPLTQYFLSQSWGTGGFFHQWLIHLADGEWLSETGPMWFCAALLLFSLAYGVVANARAGETRSPPPSHLAIGSFILAMALATFAIRIAEPQSVSFLNVHPGDFPQYTLMFAAGTFAWRRDWLRDFPRRTGARWTAVVLALSLPLFIALTVLGGALHGDTSRYAGGFNLVSLGKSLWEALVCVGMSIGLLILYRDRFDRQDARAQFLSDNAFAVYLFHPPVVVALALLLRPVQLPAPLMVALLATGVAVVTFTLSTIVFRRIPVLRQIL